VTLTVTPDDAGVMTGAGAGAGEGEGEGDGEGVGLGDGEGVGLGEEEGEGDGVGEGDGEGELELDSLPVAAKIPTIRPPIRINTMNIMAITLPAAIGTELGEGETCFIRLGLEWGTGHVCSVCGCVVSHLGLRYETCGVDSLG
jgi:hypothetical protein